MSNSDPCHKHTLEEDRSPVPTRRKGPYVVLLVALLSFVAFCYWKMPRSTSRHVTVAEIESEPEPEPELDWDDYGIMYQGLEPTLFPQETHRFDPATSKVACWPSTGGIWVGSLHSVELQYLGIDRFNIVERSSDKVREDSFCQSFRVFGASWWDLSPYSVIYRSPTGWPEFIKPHIEVNREVCVKNDGYLVLDISDKPESLPDRFWVELHQALNMEERCDILNAWGALFCENTACSAFEDLKLQPVGVRVP